MTHTHIHFTMNEKQLGQKYKGVNKFHFVCVCVSLFECFIRITFELYYLGRVELGNSRAWINWQVCARPKWRCTFQPPCSTSKLSISSHQVERTHSCVTCSTSLVLLIYALRNLKNNKKKPSTSWRFACSLYPVQPFQKQLIHSSHVIHLKTLEFSWKPTQRIANSSLTMRIWQRHQDKFYVELWQYMSAIKHLYICIS